VISLGSPEGGSKRGRRSRESGPRRTEKAQAQPRAGRAIVPGLAAGRDGRAGQRRSYRSPKADGNTSRRTLRRARDLGPTLRNAWAMLPAPMIPIVSMPDSALMRRVSLERLVLASAGARYGWPVRRHGPGPGRAATGRAPVFPAGPGPETGPGTRSPDMARDSVAPQEGAVSFPAGTWSRDGSGDRVARHRRATRGCETSGPPRDWPRMRRSPR
jgi:hypothetical protein